MDELSIGKLYITIDTEADADTHWRKGQPVSFSSVTYGIKNILRPIWDKYQVNPIYFVSPEVLDDEDSCAVLRDEIAKGAIIGAHLHPEYVDPGKMALGTVEKHAFPCSACTYAEEKEKLSNLKMIIRERLGVTPVWYRAARFGADEDTFRILAELGFKYDTSVTPGIDWSGRGGENFKSYGLKDFDIKADGMQHTVHEYPVTIQGKRWGALGKLLPDNWLFYSWLRPTHMTYTEQKLLIKRMRKKGINNLVMMFHSMEIMINKTPYVRNKAMQRYYIWRLEKTVRYAKEAGYNPEIHES